MLADLNHRLEEVSASRSRQRLLQGSLERVRRDLERTRRELAAAQAVLDKETGDLARLEDHSLAGLFYTILGSKEEQTEKERQEMLRAKLHADRLAHTLRSLEDEEASLRSELSALGNVELRYDSLLAQKEALLRQGGGQQAEQLLSVTDALARAEAEIAEMAQALQAGRQAQIGLQAMMDALGSASNWGVWDMLGGGLISTAVKHGRIDDARQAAYQVQDLLGRYRRELADVEVLSPELIVDIGALDTFADFFLDGLIFDWLVQARIDQSLENVRSVAGRLGGIQQRLEHSLSAAQARADGLAKEKQHLLESAG